MHTHFAFTPGQSLVTPVGKPQRGRPDAAPGELKRILVPIDFSDVGNQAVPCAYSVARAGSTVHLVHVLHPDALPGAEYVVGVRTRRAEMLHRKLVASCTARLRDLIPAGARACGIETAVEVVQHSQPVAAICQTAARLEADVICLATRGWPPLVRLLAGSISQQVITHSPRPILVVPTGGSTALSTEAGRAAKENTRTAPAPAEPTSFSASQEPKPTCARI